MIKISFCNVGAKEDDDEREPMLSGYIHNIFQHDQTIRACAVRGEELTFVGKFVSEIRGILSQSTFFTMVSDIVCDISALLSALYPMIQLRRILRGQLPAYRRGQIPDHDYRKHRGVSVKRSDQFKMDTMQLSVSHTTRGTLTIEFQLDWRRRVRSQRTGAADTSYFHELKSRAVAKRALVSSAVSHTVVVVKDPVDGRRHAQYTISSLPLVQLYPCKLSRFMSSDLQATKVYRNPIERGCCGVGEAAKAGPPLRQSCQKQFPRATCCTEAQSCIFFRLASRALVRS